MQPIHWQKSTYSGDGSNCVEIAAISSATHVRDSKMTGSPHLVFPSFAWVAFISHTASSSRSSQTMEGQSILDT
ncbi:DUF397 domain-containing protein [Streptomyces canus]|uniref:DUF397 domain-containing protein n=1 Tax=Streptomyces canus TaxID=58343 RepID=UPI002E28B732|nr:DUF397 domain-containing protein [Streptomyces canus]